MTVYVGHAAPNQHRMWLLSKLHPESPSYNISSPIELVGDLDVPALRAAIGELCARHEALRTTFRETGGEVHQVVAEPSEPSVTYVDVSGEPDPAQAAARLAAAAVERPMDLGAGPLFSALLCRLAPATHVLTLLVHHIVADAWSLGLLWEELSQLYSRHLGAEVTLEPPGLPYREYAAEQWRQQQSARARDELADWVRRLDGVDLDNSLRTDRPRPAVPSLRGRTVELSVPPELVRPLRARAAATRSTLFMLMVAGFAATVAHYDRRPDVVVATQVAGRADPRVARTVGFFVNTLPLRFTMAGSPALSDVVQQARAAALAAYSAEHVTYERLVQHLSPLGDRSMNPLAQVAFQLLNVPIPPVSFGRLGARRWWEDSGGAKFDVSVMLVPEPAGGLLARVTYAAELFEDRTVQSIWQAYLRVLHLLVEDPARELWTLELVDSAQRRAIERWSVGSRTEDPAESVLDKLARGAVEYGQRIAIQAGDRSVSYADLWTGSGSLACRLGEAGVRPGDTIAVTCARRFDAVPAIVAVWRAGARAVVVEPDSPSARRENLLRTLGVTMGICSPDAQPTIGGIRWFSARAGPPTQVSAEWALRPEDDAYVVTTSGSTGQPRVVAARMGSFSAFVVREAARLSADQVVVQVPPLSFDPGMRDTFLTLAAGARLLLPDGIETNPVDAVADALCEGTADSILAIVPSLLAGVVDQIASREGRTRLRTLCCCGEALTRETAGRALAVLGCVPENNYGPSECTMVSTVGRTDPSKVQTAVMPIGQPADGVETWVLGRGGRILPPGFTGEIYIGGRHLVAGYIGDPDATTDRFVAHPFGAPGSRLHRTGDLGYHDAAGVLHWVGRLDRQIKIRGVRVDLVEVESALLRHPAVTDAVVVPLGEGPDRRLVAYLATPDEGLLDDVRAHLRDLLPRAAVPTVLQPLTAIPRTERGKVLRVLLPPILPRLLRPSAGEPLADELERAIAAVCKEVLSAQVVGADDDFFGLGGHSLAAMQLAARVTASVGVPVTVADVFDHPTVRELAQHVRPLWMATRAATGGYRG